MPTRYAIAATALAVLLASCAFIHPTAPFAPVSGLTATPLNHPVIPPPVKTSTASIPAPLTLEQAVQVAVANNPEIAATQWDVSGAGSRLEGAHALRWPAISVEGGVQHFLDEQRLVAARHDGEPGIFDRDVSRGELVLNLPLFTGGRITSEIGAARLLMQSEEKRLARTREELVFNVSSTFYAMLAQREVIRSLKFSTGAMEEHRRQVSALLAAQKAARVDLLRTEVRLADLRQRLVREQNVLAIEARLLANLLGVARGVDRLSVEGQLAPEAPPVEHAEELVPAALRRRNDYLAAKARLEAQARRVDAAMAGHWPTAFLFGSYGGRIAGSGEGEDVGAVGMGVSVRLFEGGRNVAQINQELAALGAAQERLRRLELQIRQEVETAVLDIRSSGERIRAIRRSIEQAQESLRIERLKYDLGSGSITDVLDAQSALLQSETSYALALADFRIAMARLTLATGENSL